MNWPNSRDGNPRTFSILGAACLAATWCLAGCGGGPVITPKSPAPQPVSTAPRIVTVSPQVGPTSGGVTVVISGSNFQAGASVVFGGVNATSVTVLNAMQLTFTAPPHAAGAVDVTVTNPDNQTTTQTQAFTYDAAPTISGISPTSGPSTGGTAVTITGTNFQGGATVSFGGGTASSINVASSTQIQATTPPHTNGAADVVVTNHPDGQTATASGAFTFIAAHSVDLSWTASTSVVVGYNVHRGTTKGGPYPTKLNSSPVPGATYTDSTVQGGLTYYYVATAVDANNVESAFSNEATSGLIPSP